MKQHTAMVVGMWLHNGLIIHQITSTGYFWPVSAEVFPACAWSRMTTLNLWLWSGLTLRAT